MTIATKSKRRLPGRLGVLRPRLYRRPDIDPPGGWAVPPASVEGLNVVWKQYAAPSALIVRWQRLIYWVGLPEEDGTEFCVCGCPSGIVLESKPPKCSDCGQLTPVEDIEAERGR